MVRTASILLSLSLAAAGAFGGTPDGDDFQANAYTTGYQWLPSIGADGAGNFVVVWASSDSGGDDGSDYSIQGRRFTAAGDPVGGDFQVNTYTNGEQSFPSVAVDADGDFVVVWQSLGSAGADNSSFSVQGRRFASDGTAQGSDFQVNTFAGGFQGYPRVDASPAGDFVVVWHSYGSADFDNSGYSIQGQRYASDGTALAAEFQVNSYSAYDQDFPAAAVAADGGMVIVWHSRGSFGSDNPGSSVQAQRYDSGGNPQGGQLQVNAYTTGNQRSPAVAAADGSFAVAWASNGSAGSDASGYSVQARRFAADGTASGGEFQVNSYTTSGQDVPRIAMAADGSFTVVWESQGSPGSDVSGRSVQGRCYTAAGSAFGDQMQVNTYTSSCQFLPAVAAAADGSLAVAWSSLGSSGDDSDLSVQARTLDPAQALFIDGFESGDTSGWSSANL